MSIAYVPAMTQPPFPSGASIAIAGGGIIGLSIAALLGERGCQVTVYDPAEPGRGASWAAAGMLAPAFEAADHGDQHPDLLAACIASRRLWEDWARGLEDDTPGSLGFAGSGTLALATDEEGCARLEAMAGAIRAAGGTAHSMPRNELLAREPGLGDPVIAGLALASDGRIDNRAVVKALLARLEARPNVSIVRGPAPLRLVGGTVIAEGHDRAVIAAGWRSPGLIVRDGERELPLKSVVPSLAAVDPVKGQMLAVAGNADRPPHHTLRHGGLYIVPRRDRVIIGATSEPGAADTCIDPRAIADLKTAAGALLPDLSARPTLETWAGIRPGSPDHAPLVGPSEHPAILLACGHYRNGILLAPLTARLIAHSLQAGSVASDRLSDLAGLADAFSPRRFAAAPV